MTRVQQIETALKQLPVQERWEVARWLLADLQTLGQTENATSLDRPGTSVPDYAARRRRIFGGKVLPNMVLESREEERQ